MHNYYNYNLSYTKWLSGTIESESKVYILKNNNNVVKMFALKFLVIMEIIAKSCITKRYSKCRSTSNIFHITSAMHLPLTDFAYFHSNIHNVHRTHYGTGTYSYQRYD